MNEKQARRIRALLRKAGAPLIQAINEMNDIIEAQAESEESK